jgi:LmbE family N-acetylglucosaminyl deacetylase
MSKVLVIVAHPDDEILGCGGTIAYHRSQNHRIKIIFLSDGVTSRNKFKKSEIKKRLESAKKACFELGVEDLEFKSFPDNMFDSIPLIKIVKTIENVILKFKPNIIYTHSYCDLNIDHQITNRATMTACRPIEKNYLSEIYSFEVLSSTEWSIKNNNSFKPNHFVEISKFMTLKIKAIKKYSSELRKEPHPRSLIMIKSLAKVRGSSCGVKFAEAFMLERRILK